MGGRTNAGETPRTARKKSIEINGKLTLLFGRTVRPPQLCWLAILSIRSGTSPDSIRGCFRSDASTSSAAHHSI